jgi:hypothetical protein
MFKSPYLAGVLVASSLILPTAVAQASTNIAPGFNKARKPVVQRILDKVHVAKAKIQDSKQSIKQARERVRILKARQGAFLGKVTAINGNSFTLETRARGTLTIVTDSGTVFKKGALSDIIVGKTVLAKGDWDKVNKKLTAKMLLVMPMK